MYVLLVRSSLSILAEGIHVIQSPIQPDLGIVLNDVTHSLFLAISVVQNVPKTSERICLSKLLIFFQKISKIITFSSELGWACADSFHTIFSTLLCQ